MAPQHLAQGATFALTRCSQRVQGLGQRFQHGGAQCFRIGDGRFDDARPLQHVCCCERRRGGQSGRDLSGKLLDAVQRDRIQP